MELTLLVVENDVTLETKLNQIRDVLLCYSSTEIAEHHCKIILCN